MHPEICTIGPLTIYSYGLMMAIAFLVAVSLAVRQAKLEKINPEAIFNLCFWILIAGVAGARIFYVAQNIGHYLKNPLEIVMLQRGGLSWFGGLILSVFTGWVILKIKRLPMLVIFDLLAPFVALAQAIGRIGCFLNGCCYGKTSAWGIYFPVHDATLVPVQLYSTLLFILIFIGLRVIQLRPHKTGQVFWSYLALSSVARFLLDFWRADNPPVLWGLTIFQVLSAVVFLYAASRIFFLGRAKK